MPGKHKPFAADDGSRAGAQSAAHAYVAGLCRVVHIDDLYIVTQLRKSTMYQGVPAAAHMESTVRNVAT